MVPEVFDDLINVLDEHLEGFQLEGHVAFKINDDVALRDRAVEDNNVYCLHIILEMNGQIKRCDSCKVVFVVLDVLDCFFWNIFEDEVS